MDTIDLLPSNVRLTLLKEIPLSVKNIVTCFAFYDNHPRDTKEIDVVICTNRGEIQEYFKREIRASYLLENVDMKEIKILRNRRCDLFYLVVAQQNLFLLKRNDDNITLIHDIKNVADHSFDDTECNGKACLKIIQTDDAFPLIFDENFETYKENTLHSEIIKAEITEPLQIHLKRKLSEAQYCLEFNERKYKELLDLKQEAIFNISKKTCPYSSSTLNLKEVSNLMQIETRCPEVIMCNKKILIILNIENKNNVPLEEVCVFVHCTFKQSIVYTTKLYCEQTQSPFWQEKENNNIEMNCKATIVTMIDLEELESRIYTKIQFEVVLSYYKQKKALLMPFKSVYISATDIMGEDFDILSSKKYDVSKIILCILATSYKKALYMKHIKSNSNEVVTPMEIFCTHLKLDLLSSGKNVAIHKTSPYHVLHGTMVVFTDELNGDIVDIYTRSESQIIALMNYMYDSVPYRIIITTPDIQITSLSSSDEEATNNDTKKLNFVEFRKSLLKQTSLIKEYFDKCVTKMSESKNSMVKAKVGQYIDIVAQGSPKFLEFRQEILDIAEQGIADLERVNEKTATNMIIDE